CVYLSVFLRQLFASSIVVGLGKGTILEGGYANSSQQSRFRTTRRDEVCRKLQRMAISGHSHPRRIRPVQQRMKISRQAVKQTTEHLATHLLTSRSFQSGNEPAQSLKKAAFGPPFLFLTR